jgi:hypothetical protein
MKSKVSLFCPETGLLLTEIVPEKLLGEVTPVVGKRKGENLRPAVTTYS